MKNLFCGGRGKLAWIRVILVLWIFLWGLFSLFVYPSLLPDGGGYLAQVPSSFSKGELHSQSYRLDEIFSPLIQRSRTLELSSAAVPSRHRIPAGVDKNVTEYFVSSPQHVAPYREYFFDYNPSIIRIPKEHIPSTYAAKAVYLASFRVSNLQYCFHPGK